MGTGGVAAVALMIEAITGAVLMAAVRGGLAAVAVTSAVTVVGERLRVLSRMRLSWKRECERMWLLPLARWLRERERGRRLLVVASRARWSWERASGTELVSLD